jgi:hypothetical protein
VRARTKAAQIVIPIMKAVGVRIVAMRIATKTRMGCGMDKLTSNTKNYRWLTWFALPPVGDVRNVSFSSCKAGHGSPRIALKKRFKIIDMPDLDHLCLLLSIRAHSGCSFVVPEYRYMTNI